MTLYTYEVPFNEVEVHCLFDNPESSIYCKSGQGEKGLNYLFAVDVIAHDRQKIPGCVRAFLPTFDAMDKPKDAVVIIKSSSSNLTELFPKANFKLIRSDTIETDDLSTEIYESLMVFIKTLKLNSNGRVDPIKMKIISSRDREDVRVVVTVSK